jgi:transcriptional regulator with XRE-family HTH domain
VDIDWEDSSSEDTGQYIRALMNSQKWSNNWVAEVLQVDRRTVIKWTSGKRKPPFSSLYLLSIFSKMSCIVPNGHYNKILQKEKDKMNTDKYAMAKVVGEIMIVKNKLGCEVDPAVVHGLLNGIETVVDEYFEVNPITESEELQAGEVLDDIFLDPKKFKEFKGFYDIEKKLGVDRMKAIRLIEQFSLNGQFTPLIEKMDSEHSPSECRTFEWTIEGQ